MSVLKLTVVTTVILAALGPQLIDGAMAEDLRLELSPKQASFKIQGKVLVALSFVNASTKPIIVNRAYNVAVLKDCGLRISIVSDSGARPTEKLILRGRRPTQYVDDDFVRIGPGERHSEELDLGQWFELTELGNYVIRAEYWNGHQATPRGSPVWTGRATSEARSLALTR